MGHPMKARLIEIEWPDFGSAVRPEPASAEELQARLQAILSASERRGLTHLVVYGDREHFANLAWLAGFDPRFEEALLILSAGRKPLLLVGNEGEGYLRVSPLYREGGLSAERFPSFSLLNQPRAGCRTIAEIFRAEGIGPGSSVGCVGWKYFEEGEHPDARHAVELPAYLIDVLRALAGAERITNATDLLMHPEFGLRTVCSPTEIAYFEYTSTLASEGMKRIVFGLREGMIDSEVMSLARFNGEPLGCHPTFVTGRSRGFPLAGPIGAVIRRGEPLAANICYWGSNVCRAGWIAEQAEDLPAAARDYVEGFAGPYFAAMGQWFQRLKIGARGGELWRLVREELPFEKYGIYLNPGHLIHLDEWVSSPIYEGSAVPIRSGMAIQTDVIPASPVYSSTRMEDGVVVADGELRRSLQERYPDCYRRCLARREFMANALRVELPEEVLPLSNIPAIVPPFFLHPRAILAL